CRRIVSVQSICYNISISRNSCNTTSMYTLGNQTAQTETPAYRGFLKFCVQCFRIFEKAPLITASHAGEVQVWVKELLRLLRFILTNNPGTLMPDHVVVDVKTGFSRFA